jgi:hypothetical protein
VRLRDSAIQYTQFFSFSVTAGPDAQASTALREVMDGLRAMETPKGAAKARKPKRVRKLTRPARAVGTVGTVDTMMGVPSCLRQPGCVRAGKHPGMCKAGLLTQGGRPPPWPGNSSLLPIENAYTRL